MLLTAQLVASAIALILVAAYYLLASIPFSYYHFLQVPQLPFLPTFIRVHSLIVLAALALLAPRRRDLPPALQPYLRYLAAVGIPVVACMAVATAVPALQSYETAAALAFAPLLLVIGAAALHIGMAPPTEGFTAPSGRGIWRAALAGVLVGAAYVAAAASRGAATTLGRADFTAAVAVSLVAHLLSFTLAAAVAAIAGRMARRVHVARAESIAVAACAVVAVAVIVRRSLLTALILSDVRASAVAFLLALALVALAWAARVRSPRPHPASAGIWRAAALLASIVALVGVLPPMLVMVDWGGSIQKIMAMAAWGAAVALVGAASLAPRRSTMTAGICAALLTAASAAVFGAHRDGAVDAGPGRQLDLGLAVDRYATYDPSLTVLTDVFRPVVSDDQFFRTVRALGDATDDRSLSAVPMTVADLRHPPAVRPPHLFVIVVDSMRPDYLGAYNAAATFTPAITAFAHDSLVMHRAFTQYAGTALSQPAIWAGGLIQRAMYVKPFAAVDNLERLTVAAGYRRYVSVDPPLSAILEDWSGLTRLDAQLDHPERLDQMYKFDLCGTVPDLIAHLDRDGTDRPIFMYSQPQNLHIRVLAGDAKPHDERVMVAGASFFKPAVEALTRVDGCFGTFIDALKARRLYDDSIVVLTADHGDSYGEAGRWAHAFYMAPETLRIPLILHVPPKYLAGRTVDPDALALLSDVTPTLCDLLGYPPSHLADGVAGQSLFPRATDPRPVRDLVLVQSSYSRLYGLLDGDARWIYVADANHFREEWYDLHSRDPFPQPVPAAERPKYRKWIVERLGQLDRFYGAGRQ